MKQKIEPVHGFSVRSRADLAVDVRDFVSAISKLEDKLNELVKAVNKLQEAHD